MNADRDGIPGYRAVARTATPDCAITLHEGAGDYVIPACGQVLMTNQETGSERALGRVAIRLLRGVRRPRVLVGGLGMGFTLRALLDGLPRRARVVVAELLPTVVRWNRERFGHLAGHPPQDSRGRLCVRDVANLLHREAAWDAILLDVDNGPEWMVHRQNQGLYGHDGIARIEAALRPGGFLALWSVERHRPFERRLASRGLRARR